MFADELRRAVEAAPRMKLPEIAVLMWRAFAAEQITEAEAEELSGRIEVRKLVPPPPEAPSKARGSSPRTESSLERRRRWAASGRLPPALAARFTQGEAAVLAVIADTVVRYGDCRRCLGQIAALAGVCRTTVKTALHQATSLGLVTVEERRQTAWRNLPNIVRIVSPEWQAWNRLARRALPGGGGVKFPTRTNTKGPEQREKRGLRTPRRLPRRQSKASEESPDENPDARQGPQGHAGTA